MIILGIDPGIAIVGWGVIEYSSSKPKTVAYGAIQTPAGMDTEKRLAIIYNELQEIIKKYKPECMAVEELFWNTNQKTGISVSEARGVILLCAELMGVAVFEYTPLQVKQGVVGYGRADKKQVITMVSVLLNIKEKITPDDTADALAIALCHAHCGASKIAQYYNKKQTYGKVY